MAHDSTEERLQKIEESIGFAQHESGTLSAEVRALGQKLDSISRRLASIESAFGALAERVAGADEAEPMPDPLTERPPHAAAPESDRHGKG